jgi:VWFA-related protein
VLALFLLLQATQPPAVDKPAQPVFPSDVELVALDVSVVDENGRPVRDLQPQDFEVRIGRKPRKVVSVEFLSHNGEAPEEKPGPPPTHYSTNERLLEGRLILLAVDEANISAGDGAHAVRAAEKLLQRVGPADRVGLLTMPGPLPREDFTADHQKVRDALQRISGKGRFQGERVSLTEAVAFAHGEDPQRWRDLVARLCRPGDMTCPDQLEAEARHVFSEYQAQSARSLQVLRATFQALGAVEGTKVMVLVTQGLGLPGAGTRGGSTPELQQLASAARAARVSFFVVLIDPPLVSASSNGQITSQQLVEDRDLHARALDFVADAARGTVLRGAPEMAFERIAREITGHYQIGFEPEERDRDGKDHEVQVKLRRPKLVVRVGRDVAIPKADAARDERAQLVALLRSPQMATGLSLRTATWMLKDMPTGKLRVFVETDTASGRAPGAASVAYLLLDDKGKPAATALLARTPAEKAAGGVSLTVAPGQYTLRAAARDARGRVGSVFHAAPAALQAAEGVELSDLLLGPAPEQGKSFRPAPDPTLAAAGASLGAHVELYANEAAQLDPLIVWLDVVRADTATVARTVRAQIGATAQQGRRVAQAMIRRTGLEPGDYVARAKVFSGERELLAVSRPFRVAPH